MSHQNGYYWTLMSGAPTIAFWDGEWWLIGMAVFYEDDFDWIASNPIPIPEELKDFPLK